MICQRNGTRLLRSTRITLTAANFSPTSTRRAFRLRFDQDTSRRGSIALAANTYLTVMNVRTVDEVGMRRRQFTGVPIQLRRFAQRAGLDERQRMKLRHNAEERE